MIVGCCVDVVYAHVPTAPRPPREPLTIRNGTPMRAAAVHILLMDEENAASQPQVTPASVYPGGGDRIRTCVALSRDGFTDRCH